MGILNNLFGSNEAPKNQASKSAGIFDKFISAYKPATELIKPAQQILDWYADKLPAELLEFWKAYGFGNYGNGLIKVIEPSAYMDSFYGWIGKQDFSKIPILVTAFGDIFYYRKLSATEEDVSLLDIHYRNIDVCDYSLQNFFEDYIVDEELAEDLLKKPLFAEALTKLGPLNPDEIYYFEPALFLGGAQEAKYLAKGKGSVHQQVLLQLGQQAGL